MYAVGCLRTANGLRLRESSSLRWSQWMLFFTIAIGGLILLSVIIPVGLKFSLLLGQDIDLRTVINDEIGGLAPIALSIGEGLIAICLLLISLVALLALIVFLIPPLEALRTMPGRWPHRFAAASLYHRDCGCFGDRGYLRADCRRLCRPPATRA